MTHDAPNTSGSHNSEASKQHQQKVHVLPPRWVQTIQHRTLPRKEWKAKLLLASGKRDTFTGQQQKKRRQKRNTYLGVGRTGQSHSNGSRDRASQVDIRLGNDYNIILIVANVYKSLSLSLSNHPSQKPKRGRLIVVVQFLF